MTEANIDDLPSFQRVHVLAERDKARKRQEVKMTRSQMRYGYVMRIHEERPGMLAAYTGFDVSRLGVGFIRNWLGDLADEDDRLSKDKYLMLDKFIRQQYHEMTSVDWYYVNGTLYPSDPAFIGKKCRECGQRYPKTSHYWYKDSKGADGLYSVCKYCKRKQSLDYYHQHKFDRAA